VISRFFLACINFNIKTNVYIFSMCNWVPGREMCSSDLKDAAVKYS